MNLTEATVLCRYVKTIAPSQVMDEFTPEGWADVMWDISITDAKAACAAMIRAGERFIDPGRVVFEVKKVRRDRLAKFGPIAPPPGLTDGQEREWIRRATTAIAAGEVTTPEQLGLPALPKADPGRVRRMIESAIPRVNSEEESA